MKIDGQIIECERGWMAELNFKQRGCSWTAYTNTHHRDPDDAVGDGALLAESLGGTIDWMDYSTPPSETPADE